MKVLIGIPTNRYIHWQTVGCLFEATNFMREGIHYELGITVGSFIHQNRNNLVKQALEGKCDYLLFIDSDMIFPKEAITKLIARDTDIIACPANRRKIPLENNIKTAFQDGKYLTIPNEHLPEKPFQVHAIGTGFMLIKTKVFEAMPKPWFSYGNLESFDDFIGEDVYFCEQAKKAGFEIWCDPTIKIGHTGEYVY